MLVSCVFCRSVATLQHKVVVSFADNGRFLGLKSVYRNLCQKKYKQGVTVKKYSASHMQHAPLTERWRSSIVVVCMRLANGIVTPCQCLHAHSVVHYES